MELITRTIYGSYLQTCLTMKRPFIVAENTTLNEKFGIQSGVNPANGVYPELGYWCIGNGGMHATISGDYLIKKNPIQHRGTDAALFKHTPFVLRETNNDLSSTERARYRLRREEVHNGRSYYAYYARKIDLTTAVVGMEYISVVDGVETPQPFIPNSSHLNPQPPLLDNNGVNIVSGDMTSVTTPIALTFSIDDIKEYLDVCRILFGDDNAATITEIAIVSGVDKVVSVTGYNNVAFNFTEIIAAQVNSHLIADYNLKFLTESLTINLDVGSTEPLFVLTE